MRTTLRGRGDLSGRCCRRPLRRQHIVTFEAGDHCVINAWSRQQRGSETGPG